MTKYKCSSAESCQFGEMCKPNYNISACYHYKAKEPITNEEWLKSLDTEELAIWIERIMFIVRYREKVEDGAYMQMMTKKDYIESWLMEIHK